MAKVRLEDVLTVNGGSVRLSVSPPKWLEEATRRAIAALTPGELNLLRSRYKDDPEALEQLNVVPKVRCCECGGTDTEPRGLCGGVLHDDPSTSRRNNG